MSCFRVELLKALNRIGRTTFGLEDLNYLKEYVLVMTSVAQASDKLEVYASYCFPVHNEP